MGGKSRTADMEDRYSALKLREMRIYWGAPEEVLAYSVIDYHFISHD